MKIENFFRCVSTIIVLFPSKIGIYVWDLSTRSWGYPSMVVKLSDAQFIGTNSDQTRFDWIKKTLRKIIKLYTCFIIQTLEKKLHFGHLLVWNQNFQWKLKISLDVFQQ